MYWFITVDRAVALARRSPGEGGLLDAKNNVGALQSPRSGGFQPPTKINGALESAAP